MHLPVTARLRLMQLCSPSLPVGAFAYSHGIEGIVGTGKITNESDAALFLTNYVPRSLAYLELPRLFRMHKAFERGNCHEAHEQSRLLYAARETRELRAQESQIAHSFHRLLSTLAPSGSLEHLEPITFAELFAYASVHWQIDAPSAMIGYSYLYVDGQVTATAKLLALGPVSSQRLLSKLLELLPNALKIAETLKDEDIGATAPGVALASAQHETQHFRLFRS